MLRSCMARMLRDERGQATVEAAFAVPVLMVLVLVLVQPGIILYDRIVMEGAAAAGCRLLATLPESDCSCSRASSCTTASLWRGRQLPAAGCWRRCPKAMRSYARTSS